MKRSWTILMLAVCVGFFCGDAEGSAPRKIEEAVITTFPPAVYDKALDTAHVQLDSNLFRGFVVLKKGGIPAERARFFIQWQEYDYRGAVIHLDKGDKITTRRDSPYTYLQRGDVMAVAGSRIFHNTVYLKLISADVYIPENRQQDSHHSRVTVMLGFKFPKKAIEDDDAKAVIDRMKEWLEPFTNIDSAEAFAAGIREIKAVAEAEGSAADAVKAVKKAEDKGEPVDKERIRALEDKIESARQQMEEAEKEMRKLREEIRD